MVVVIETNDRVVKKLEVLLSNLCRICHTFSMVIVDKALSRILGTRMILKRTLTLRIITLVPEPYAIVSPSVEIPILVAAPLCV